MRLSLVVPAYNEEARFPAAWAGLQPALAPFGDGCEVIVVDDGSTDGTARVVGELASRDPRLRLVASPRNEGRGAAVRRGAALARGELVLELDADGSVEPEAVGRFASFMERHPSVDVAVGSRNVAGSVVLRRQPRLRVFLGGVFLALAKGLFDRTIADYTLGFKMFRREAARDVFARQRAPGFVAEAELVFLAQRRGWRVAELPVRWADYVGDSRVRPLADSWRSARALLEMAASARRGDYDSGARGPDAPRAEAELRARHRGLSWPSLFTRIRLLTAPYRRLEPLLPREGLIVDVGSGYGTFSNLLALLAPGRRVLALELDADKAAAAPRGVPGVEFRREDAVAADYPDADAIVLTHVLHHLGARERQEALLRRLAARLKPGGLLLVCEVEARPAWKHALGFLADRLLYPGEPVLYRPRGEWERLLAEAGLQVDTLKVDEGTPFSHVAFAARKPAAG